MNNSRDSSNPIAKSLQKFGEEMQKRSPLPASPSGGKIEGSQSFQGKVDPGRYGYVGDKRNKL